MVTSSWLSQQNIPLCGWVEAPQPTEQTEQGRRWKGGRWVQPHLYAVHGNSAETEARRNWKFLFKLGWIWGPTFQSQKYTNKQGFPCRAPSFSSLCAWAPCPVQHIFLSLSFQFYPKERSRWTRQLMSHFNTVARPTWPTKAAGLRTPAGFISYQGQTVPAPLTTPAVLVCTSTLPEELRGDGTTHLSPGF